MHNPLKRRFEEQTVKDAYAAVAWFYNSWSRMTESRAAGTVLELARIKNGERILEVAVGTGLVFAEIVKRNQHGINAGLDLSESMLQRAEKRMKNIPKDRYELHIGNAFKLPFNSQHFDLLINNFMLDLLPEQDFVTVLTEFKRVLKPGGRIVVSTMTFGRKWYNRTWHLVANYLPSLLTGCRPIAIGPYLMQVGYDIVDSVYISQNTFPSEVTTARISGNFS